MWGTNEKDEKVLIALALRAEDNAVDIYTFPFESTSEEFYNLMLNEWREAHEVSFPEGHTHIVRPLTASDGILPDHLKVDRADIIQRAQTEWHFVVLSNKLYHSFLSELQDIKEKIKGSDFYKNQMWEEMKEAWEKIQKNIFDKSLMREHGQQLREMTNDIFTQLKNMRKDMDSEIDRVSHDFAEKFNKKLDEVEEKIKSGLGLQPLFNDLKRLQQEFKDAQLSRNDRSKIWKRIDVAFKAVKVKNFGEKFSNDTSALDRVNRRYEGLMSSIDKMEKSIRRDDKDKSFQDDRIANTEGQLEAQIRMAKLKMIDERINSKNEKLAEMQKTKAELEERISREKKFLEEQRKQQTMKEELKEAKENVKQKIAESIHAQSDHLDADILGKAAEAIAQEKAGKSKQKNKESFLGAVTGTLGESLSDVGDSMGAIASVVAERIEDAFKEWKEEAGDAIKDAKENVKETFDQMKNKMNKDDNQEGKEPKEGPETKTGEILSNITDKIDHVFKDLKQDAEGLFKDVKEEVKEAIDDIRSKIKKEDSPQEDQTGTPPTSSFTDKVENVFKDLKDEAGDIYKDVKGDVKSGFDNIRNKIQKEDSQREEWETGESTDAKAKEIFSGISDKIENVFKDLKEEADEVLKDVKEEVRETVDELKEKLKKKGESREEKNPDNDDNTASQKEDQV